MSQPKNTRLCPNCGANNPAEATVCAICDTRLTGITPRQASRAPLAAAEPPPLYNPAEGEDDLMVSGPFGTPLAGLIGVVVCLLLSAALGGAVVYLMDDDTGDSQVEALPTPTLDPAEISPQPPTPTPLPTNTRPAPPLLPTVTPLPPTATPTPTPGPCIQTAQQGDTVYGMAIRCGHRHLSIVPVIVEFNTNLESETALREGQVLEIPWPTPTPGEEPPTEDADADEDGEPDDTSANPAARDQNTSAVTSDGTPDELATLFVEPTLRPGLMWHTVSEDETLITLVQMYNADAKVISDLNPEIEFRQCNFGERFGGPNCSVIFYMGQQVRVPAPTPTPTIPPTASGNETPTPTPTATFNVPQAFAPEEDARFGSSQLVTLRWQASGTLAANEVYLVTVRNLDRERTFQARTEELFFVIPATWQASGSGDFTYEWTVAIATIEGDSVTATRQQTQPRRFVWAGRS